MASIAFYSGTNFIDNLSNSGVGFYGAGFGYSVPVGSYQDTTYITNSNGTSQGPQCNNIKYLNDRSGIINSASAGTGLLWIPNAYATLNVRFTHTSAVKTQNAKLYIYDRTNTNNDPSGVTCKVAELIHPDPVANNNGSGSSTWVKPTGSSLVMSLATSPGMSGLCPNGASITSDRHDFYIAISASPDSIGSKSFAAYFSVEYL